MRCPTRPRWAEIPEAPSGSPFRFRGRDPSSTATRNPGCIGGAELELPEFAEAVEQSALAYVRTHEIDVAPAPNGHLAIEATIRHFRFHGASVLLELSRADGQVLEVDIPRARFDELGITKGQRVYLSPRSIRVFPSSGPPRTDRNR